jgi:YVTN family beta-propeller protein
MERDRPTGGRRLRAGMSAPVRRCGLLLVALAALVPAIAACATPVGGTTVGDVAWVATAASVTLPGTAVTPVALARRHIGAKVSLGSLPSALAYTPESKGLLVVTQGTDSLHEIDPATHQVLHSVGTGVEPDAVAVAPGGTGGKGVALVANLDSNTVTPVDLGTWRAGTPVAVGTEPVAIAVSVAASGAATAFVADYGSNSVTPIDVAALQPGASIAVGPGPQTIAATPSEVLVGNFGNRTLTAINPATLRAGGSIPLPLNPTGIALSATGATAYVCGSAAVVPVAVVGLTLGAPVALPDVAQGVALSTDGTTAWVTQQTGTLVPVTLVTGKVGRPIRVGGHPSAIVIGPG